MKKSLIKNQTLYFYRKEIKYIVNRNDKSTYPIELSGNISSELSGNISGLSGSATNISGNLDDCEITEEEREKGVDIEKLVKD